MFLKEVSDDAVFEVNDVMVRAPAAAPPGGVASTELCEGSVFGWLHLVG